MKGRLAVLEEYGQPLVLREYDVPRAQPGAILVRITQASICGSDLHMWRHGAIGAVMPETGRAMGHEGTGVVHELGEGVTTDYLGRPLNVGDRIVHSVVVPCHRCHMCLRGEDNLCLNKVRTPPAGTSPYFVGTFADYYYVPPGMPVFKVPESLPDDLLAPVNCAMGTVTQGLLGAGVGEGDCVVLQGAGGLGLMGAAMAKDMGADQVIVLDRLDNRLEIAREFGADHTISVSTTTREDRVAQVHEITQGRGADVVVELVGAAELLTEGVEMLRPGGTFVDIGLWFGGQTVEFDPSTIVMSGKKIIGSAIYRPAVLPTILDFLVRNLDRRPFHRLVSHRFELSDVNDAFAQSEWARQDTAVVRAVLVP